MSQWSHTGKVTNVIGRIYVEKLHLCEPGLTVCESVLVRLRKVLLPQTPSSIKWRNVRSGFCMFTVVLPHFGSPCPFRCPLQGRMGPNGKDQDVKHTFFNGGQVLYW